MPELLIKEIKDNDFEPVVNAWLETYLGYTLPIAVNGYTNSKGEVSDFHVKLLPVTYPDMVRIDLMMVTHWLHNIDKIAVPEALSEHKEMAIHELVQSLAERLKKYTDEKAESSSSKQPVFDSGTVVRQHLQLVHPDGSPRYNAGSKSAKSPLVQCKNYLGMFLHTASYFPLLKITKDKVMSLSYTG